MTVGVVGLGLIGGSMAKTVKARTADRVLGWNRGDEAMQLARASGAIDGTLTDEAMGACDLVMIAVPPAATLAWVREKAPHLRGTVLVDLCGVKRYLFPELSRLAEENGFSYVGGHPMAGREVAGFRNASAALYEGASMILVPTEHTDILLLEKLKAYYLSLGFGRVTFSTPEEHDRIIAYTSQLAHVASSAYIKSPTAQRQMGFSAGSYRDMTRVARLDEKLWTELFLANADFLTEELRELIGHLNEYLAALEARDPERLCAALKDGRERKQTAGGT